MCWWENCLFRKASSLDLLGPARAGVQTAMKSNSVGGFGRTPPPFFKMVYGGVLRVFFDADTPFLRKIFWWYSFGLHIQSFVIAPDSATFDFVP